LTGKKVIIQYLSGLISGIQAFTPRRAINLELSSPLKAKGPKIATGENPLEEKHYLSIDQPIAGSAESNSNSIIITVTTHCHEQPKGTAIFEQSTFP
jgi:hypothetical protein